MTASDVYSQLMMQLNNREEPLDNPFPRSFRWAMHGTNCSQAWPAQSSWQCLTYVEMVSIMKEDDVVSEQVKLSAGKVLILFQEVDTMEKAPVARGCI